MAKKTRYEATGNLNKFTMSDGAEMTTRTFEAKGPSKGTVIALHGIQDYSIAFRAMAQEVTEKGYTLIALDQRGHGNSPVKGKWGGEDRMIADLQELTEDVRAKEKGKPVIWLGESMGGAVMLAAHTKGKVNKINAPDKMVLVSPAVWGSATMNPLLQLLLMTVNLIPFVRDWSIFPQAPWIKSTDNEEVWNQMMRDPRHQKSSSAARLAGLKRLMTSAETGLRYVKSPTLVLTGDKDQVVPKKSFDYARGQMFVDDGSLVNFKSYKNGYHMLLRDKEGHKPRQDILNFILG